MENIDILKVTLKDIGQLQKIGRQTFLETFSAGPTNKKPTAETVGLAFMAASRACSGKWT
jgi:hypothetical protein